MAAVGAATLVALAPGVAGAGVRAGATYHGVLFRPVLCAVPPYDRFITTPQPDGVGVVVRALERPRRDEPRGDARRVGAGYSYQSPQPDNILEAEKTTKPSADSAKKVVLLSGLRGSSIYSATTTSAGDSLRPRSRPR